MSVTVEERDKLTDAFYYYGGVEIKNSNSIQYYKALQFFFFETNEMSVL